MVTDLIQPWVEEGVERDISSLRDAHSFLFVTVDGKGRLKFGAYSHDEGAVALHLASQMYGGLAIESHRRMVASVRALKEMGLFEGTGEDAG